MTKNPKSLHSIVLRCRAPLLVLDKQTLDTANPGQTNTRHYKPQKDKHQTRQTLIRQTLDTTSPRYNKHKTQHFFYFVIMKKSNLGAPPKKQLFVSPLFHFPLISTFTMGRKKRYGHIYISCFRKDIQNSLNDQIRSILVLAL